MLIYDGIYFHVTMLLNDAVSCWNCIAFVINEDYVALADGYWQGNTKLKKKKNCHIASLSTINPTQTELVLNSGLHGETLAVNGYIHGTLSCEREIIHNK